MPCIQIRTEDIQAKHHRMNSTMTLYYWTFVCIWLPSVIGETNIALGKPASQSTTWPNAEASRANDGNRASNFASGSCSHTQHEPTNWWQVDLQGIYSIGSVFIVNRDSQVTGTYFLQDLEVHVFWEEPPPGLPNGTVCATHIPAMGVNATLQCEAPVIGRFLRIYRRSVGMPKLVFCEVEVYGRPATTCGVFTFEASQGKQAICDKSEVHSNSTAITCSILCLQSRVCRAYNYVGQTPAVCELIYDISVIDRFEASTNADFYELICE